MKLNEDIEDTIKIALANAFGRGSGDWWTEDEKFNTKVRLIMLKLLKNKKITKAEEKIFWKWHDQDEVRVHSSKEFWEI